MSSHVADLVCLHTFFHVFFIFPFFKLFLCFFISFCYYHRGQKLAISLLSYLRFLEKLIPREFELSQFSFLLCTPFSASVHIMIFLFFNLSFVFSSLSVFFFIFSSLFHSFLLFFSLLFSSLLFSSLFFSSFSFSLFLFLFLFFSFFFFLFSFFFFLFSFFFFLFSFFFFLFYKHTRMTVIMGHTQRRNSNTCEELGPTEMSDGMRSTNICQKPFILSCLVLPSLSSSLFSLCLLSLSSFSVFFLCLCFRVLVVCVSSCVFVWCGVVWCGVVWCGVVWCGVVWCGVVWCGVVWCGVVWCGVAR